MDKQEYREFLDEIKYEYDAGDYKKVISCANAVDIRKIREPRILEIVSSAYEKQGQIKKAKDVLLEAYESNNIRRQIVYKLCELSVQEDEVDEAIQYYEDFRRIAPKDNAQYLLKYKIGRAGGASLQQLIGVLEAYNNRENDEQWKYELACLYHEAGDSEKCISACDEVFLWYGDGEYVKKALELKNSYTALTNVQQRKYEEMMQEFLKPEEMSPEIPLYNAEDDSIAEEFANEFLGEKTPKIEEAMLQESIQLNGGKIENYTEELKKTQIQEQESVEALKSEPEEYEIINKNVVEETEDESEPEEEFIIESRETKKPVYEKSGEGDTCVIPLSAIRKELDEECGEPLNVEEQPDDELKSDDIETRDIEHDTPIVNDNSHDTEDTTEEVNEEVDLGITTTITLAQLRKMLREDNIIDDDDLGEYEESLVEEPVSEEIDEVDEKLEVVEPEFAEIVEEPEVEETVSVEPEAEKSAEEPETAEPETMEIVEEPEAAKIVEEPVTIEPETIPLVVSEVLAVETVNVSPVILAKLGMTELKKSPLASEVTKPDLCPKTEPEKNMEEEVIQDPVAVERLKQIQQEVDIDSKVVLPYSMDDPSFENIEMEEYKAQESEAEKAIAAFDMKADDEPEVEDEDLTAIGDSLADMMSAEILIESQDDYAEYDNSDGEEISEKPLVKNLRKNNSASQYMLSEFDRNEMSEFLLIDGMEEQICTAIGQILEDRKQGKKFGGNLVVTGDAKCGKTYLAIAMIKAIAEELGSGDGKVAKVQAEALNGKSLVKVFSKIIGSDLVIENVGNLADGTIEDLIGILKTGKLANMVVLEGNQLAVDNIFANYPELGRFYDARVDINELSILQWAELAIKYAEDNGYVLDDLAKLALHAKINEKNLPTTRLGYSDILDTMDDAMEKADKRNVGRLFGAFRRNANAQKEIIESDFD